MSPATTKRQSSAKSNGNGASANGQGALAEAIVYEQALAAEAAALRGESIDLTLDLFSKLLPLLRRPIPPGFITTTPKTEGKPYDSTGIRSVQVQVDRMDNVLTPAWWGYVDTYEEEGKLCRVSVWIGGDREKPLVERKSYGGVNRGSTIGNLYKGSFTNAAKRAIALVGPGHEVYLGAADFDPDVDEDAAKVQATPEPAPKVERIDADRAAHLRDLFDKSDIDAKKLQTKLGALGVVNVRTVNTGLASLTPGQADELETWLGGAE